MAAEKQFENEIKKFLYQQNCWLLKYWGGGGYTKSGIPDLLICCNGRFVAVEVKAKTGEPSMLQLVTLKRITESCGVAVLLYPDDFDRFKDMIRAIWAARESEISRHKMYFASKINQELLRRTK